MLISKYVNIKATGSLVKKFNCKKYDIIKISIDELTHGSRVIVEVECDYCGIISNIEYCSYFNQIKTINKYTCISKKCRSLKSKEINLEKYGVKSVLLLDSVKNKIKKTNLERYGSENVFGSDEIKNKLKETNLERYGVENPGWTIESQYKIKKTNLERYGAENPGWTIESQYKIKKTNLERYGAENVFGSDEVKNKIRQTNIEKYGVKCPLSSDFIRDKIKKTNLERYGFEYASQSDNVKTKVKETNLKRYGSENYSQSDDYAHKYKKSLHRKEYNGYYYQSKYELDFLKLCETNNVNISNYTPSIIYYLNNKKHKYYPDFYYEKYNLVIEIKSTYWYNKHIIKNKEKEKQTKLDGYNYIIIMDKNYEEFLQKIN